MKKIISVVLVLSMTMGLVSCTPGLKDRIKVEDQLGKLTNVDGNTLINEDEEYEAMVNSLLYMINDTDLQGVWLVATDDDVIFATGQEILDNEGNVVDPYTTFEIGSMSKSFVAVCIFKLMEEGKISLDDTLGDLFPEYSSCPYYEATSKVTISDMLHMRSGIPDYLNAPDKFWDEEVVCEIIGADFEELREEAGLETFYTSLEEEYFLERVFTCEPNSEPDTEFEYSNTNFYLLSVIIEHITGKAYQDYVREVIFDPCNMTDTSSMAFGDVEASLPEDAFYFRPEYSKGAGDIHSTAVDILKYDRALFGGYLLKDDSLETMLTPVGFYACGLEVMEGTVQHGGDTPGFTCGHYIIERNGQHLYVTGWSHQGDRGGIINLLDRLFDPKPKSNKNIYIVIGASAVIVAAAVCVVVGTKKKKSKKSEA